MLPDMDNEAIADLFAGLGRVSIRRMFGGKGIYFEGMIIAIHSRANDLMVNPTKGKQLTNIRSAGADEIIILTPPIKFSLEQALE